jgi:N-glycosylase/DNA lyase
MNEFMVNLGIDASFIQEYLGAEIVERIAESKKIEIPIPSDSDVEAILGDEMIEFELLNVPSVLGDRGMPKFHILTMVTADIKKLTSRLKICKKDEGSPKLDKIDNHEKLGKTAREF